MKFDDKFNELLTAMVEVCLEYVDYDKDEIEMTYVYGCLEDFVSFQYFYKIKGQFVEKHKVNNYTKKKYDTTPDMQQQVLDVGSSNLEAFSELFKSDGRQIPTHIKMIYDNQSGAFNSDLSYDNLLGEDLMPEDLIEEWITTLKND